jgi:hypothetical protein
MRRSLVVLAAMLWTFQVCADWRVAARVGGAISAVAAHGSIAFVASGARVQVFDITDPAVPRLIGSTPSFADDVAEIVVSTSRAYVAAGTGGVYMVDLSDPAAPRVLGQWDSPGSAEGVALAGTLLYVADGPFGLAVVDVTNPAAPTPVASAFDTFFAFDVVVRDRAAYVAAADAGLLVVDVTVPAAPRELSIVDTPGYARDLIADGSMLYVADQWAGVRVLSLAQPFSPHEVTAVTLPSWALDLALSADTLYVAGGSRGLQMIDVSDATRPRVAGDYPIPLKVTWKVAVAGGRVLAGVRTEGVHIVDVTQPDALRRVGVISPLVSASAVAVKGDFAYTLTADQGMRIVDFTRSDRPRERGGGPTLQGLVGGIATVGENHVYVGSGIQGRHQLDVFDVSDPDRPVLARSLTIFNFAWELALHGSHLYMPNEFGLEVFDVTNPAEPVVRGGIAFPEIAENGGATSVAFAGTHAFVSAGWGGLRVVDISQPANMQVVGSWEAKPATAVGALAYRDGHLYAAAGPVLFVLDVRDPRQPVLLTSVNVSGGAGDILLDGRHAYLASYGGGVAILDIGDPARPVMLGQIRSGGFALELARKDGDLLVASSTGGLVLLTRTQQSAVSSAVLDPAPPIAATPPFVSATPLSAAAPRAAPAVAAANAQRSVIVTSAADSGPGTLREALSNLASGDAITFDPAVFPPNAPATIRVAAVLPHIKVSNVTIDASNAGVVLDGSLLSGDFRSGIEIAPASKNNVIRGMQIVNFPWAAIQVSGGGGNLIGGDRRRGAGPTGEGNVLSGNGRFGIHVDAPDGNVIVGNLIGTDVTGRIGLGRQMFGIDLMPAPGSHGGSDRIGGHEPWEANVIAGNAFAEISLHNGSGHSVIGNFIGTDANGNRVGDADVGVSISASSDNLIAENVIVSQNAIAVGDQGACCNRIVDNCFGVTRDRRFVPREIANEDGVRVWESFNLVHGNVFGGMPYAAVRASGLVDTVVETIIGGNEFLGVSATRGMSSAAIEVHGSSRTFIGGTTPAFRNEINAGATAVELRASADRTFIVSNAIGSDDEMSLRNIDGIDVGSASFTFVQRNVIANNGGTAVTVGAGTNRIRQNSIYRNRQGPIDVGAAAGVPGSPVITGVTSTSVTGTSCAGCTIEIFSDGETQARWYEGSTVADTNGRYVLTRAAPWRGSRITATATDASGSTSALSPSVAAPAMAPRRRAVRH